MKNFLKYIERNQIYLGLDNIYKYSYQELIIYFNLLQRLYDLYCDVGNIPNFQDNNYNKYHEYKIELSFLLHKCYLELRLSKEKFELRYNSSKGNCLYDALSKTINTICDNNEDYKNFIIEHLKATFNQDIVLKSLKILGKTKKTFFEKIMKKVNTGLNIIDILLEKKFDENIIRLLIGTFYELTKHEYINFVNFDNNNIVQPTILKDKSWGNEFEISLASKLFRISIKLYNSQGEHNSQIYDLSNINNPIQLNLAYISPNHYNSIRQKSDDVSIENSENIPLNIDFNLIIKHFIDIIEKNNIEINLNEEGLDQEINYRTKNLGMPFVSYKRASKKSFKQSDKQSDKQSIKQNHIKTKKQSIKQNHIKTKKQSSKKAKKDDRMENNKIQPDVLKTIKRDTQIKIIKEIEKNPSKIEMYQDILNHINVDLKLSLADLFLCKTLNNKNSLYYSFMVVLNDYLKKNVIYKQILFNKIVETDYLDNIENIFLEDKLDIDTIKILCFKNMINTKDKLSFDLQYHIDNPDLSKKIGKIGKKLLRKDYDGDIITTTSLCDFFMLNITIVTEEEITNFQYKNPAIIIENTDKINNNNLVLALDTKKSDTINVRRYYPTDNLNNISIDKSLLNYNDVISSFK